MNEAGASERVAKGVHNLLVRLEERRAEWFIPVLLMLVRDGLESLRAYLEKPEETEITWSRPAVELRWPIPWDWARWDAGRLAWAGPEPEDLIRRAETLEGEEGVDALVEAVLDFVVLNTLQALASWCPLPDDPDGAVYGTVLEEGRLLPLIPQSLADELGLPGLDEDSLGGVVADLYDPFTFNRAGLNALDPALTEELATNLLRRVLESLAKGPEAKHDGGDGAETVAEAGGELDAETRSILKDASRDALDILEDPLRLEVGLDDGRALHLSIRLEVHPFVVDPAARAAYFPVMVALVHAETGEPADLSGMTEEDAGRFWSGAFEWLAHFEGTPLDEALGGIFGHEKEEPEERGDAGAPAALPARVKTVAPQRYLLDGPTRMDRAAASFVAHLEKVTLPKKWSAVRAWGDLVQDEIRRLTEEYGDAAFLPTDQRGPLLTRRNHVSGPKGARVSEEVVELAREAEEGLLERLAGIPYRRVLKDEDGRLREYLVKRVRAAGGGTVEVRLSWYESAWRLVDSARDEQRKILEEERRRLDGSLFETLDPKEKEALDNALEHMRAVRDGRKVMECILAAFGRDGRNPVTIPAWELRTLLECEKDPNGLQRVRGCLRALQEIRYHAKGAGTGAPFRAWGAFLGTVEYDPHGAGGHGEGVFHVQVGEPFLGVLAVFGAGHRIHNARKVLVYEWTKDLTKDDRGALGGGYVQGFTALGVYYDRAKGFTDHQSRLRRWIGDELTLNRDGAGKGRKHLRAKRNAAGAQDPRVYDSSFCPVLPEGRGYFAALSHFDHNPESGRTLYGGGSRPTRTSGAKTPGLLAEMGYEVPTGRSWAKRTAVLRKFLEDLRAVVEEAMGGVVAVNHGGRWYSLEEAVRSIPEKELGGRAKWFLFVAEDWPDRLRRDIEAHHAGRHARGETPYPVKVTTNREVHRRSQEALQGVRYEEEGASSGGNESAPPALPLHHRLQAARKHRGLSQADVGAMFGVSKMTVSKWEAGPLPDEEGKVRGLPIPDELVPLVRRWVETEEPPAPEELAARRSRRAGVNPATGKPWKPDRGGGE